MSLLFDRLPEEVTSKEINSRFGNLFLQVLKEYAEKSYNLSLLLDIQYQKLKSLLENAYENNEKILSDDYYTSPYNNLKGKYLKIDDIYCVFLEQGELGDNCAFAIESEDPNHVVYCALLTDGKITKEVYKALLTDFYERSFKHELTHIYDKQRYTGKEPHLEVRNEKDRIRYYNHALERNSHNSEIRAYIKNYIDTEIKNYSEETRKLAINIILNELISVRRGIYQENFLDSSLIKYIQYQSEENFKKLLKYMFEFICEVFDKKIEEQNAKENM